MLPHSVTCDECGKEALVRGYGRIEYDWDDTDDPAAMPTIRMMRLTVDCPTCGLRVQEHFPNSRPVGSRGMVPGKLVRRIHALSAAFRS
jgi:endogenous inhibitor of DNA gyrase (YacG/DUF329 family)